MNETHSLMNETHSLMNDELVSCLTSGISGGKCRRICVRRKWFLRRLSWAECKADIGVREERRRWRQRRCSPASRGSATVGVDDGNSEVKTEARWNRDWEKQNYRRRQLTVSAKLSRLERHFVRSRAFRLIVFHIFCPQDSFSAWRVTVKQSGYIPTITLTFVNCCHFFWLSMRW